jgi:protein SCO1/2
MKSARSRAALFAAVCTVLAAGAWSPARSQYPAAPNERLTLGTAVPRARLFDENGDTLALYDLAGKPLILSPVFTTCPHACPAITASLEQALEGLGGCGKTFNVLTLSFDPNDTPQDLRAYRQKTGMPAEWKLAGGTPDQVLPVMDAIDFRFEALPGGGYAHPNVVVLLSPELTVSGYVHGLMYTQDEMKAALRAAAGHPSLLDRARPLLIPISAVFLVLTFLVILLTARKRAPAGE